MSQRPSDRVIITDGRGFNQGKTFGEPKIINQGTPTNPRSFNQGDVVGEPSPTRPEPRPNTDANNILNSKSNTNSYLIIGAVIVVGYFIYKKIKK